MIQAIAKDSTWPNRWLAEDLLVMCTCTCTWVAGREKSSATPMLTQVSVYSNYLCVTETGASLWRRMALDRPSLCSRVCLGQQIGCSVQTIVSEAIAIIDHANSSSMPSEFSTNVLQHSSVN